MINYFSQVIRSQRVKKYMIGLPCTYILRSSGCKLQIGTKLPFFYFRIRLRHLQFITDTVTGKVSRQSGYNTLHVMFVNLRLYFQVRISGGRWMYVVDESGKFAIRQPIRIGRQNPQYYGTTRST